MNPVQKMFTSGEVIFIEKPVSGHSWFVIQQNQRSYVFFDPNAIQIDKAKHLFFEGTRAGLYRAIEGQPDTVTGEGG